MNLRKEIAGRFMAKGPGPLWMLDVLVHLTDQGIDADDAIKAMGEFVDEMIAIKNGRRWERADEVASDREE